MDIRRTLLWIIFSFSLLLLWNNWQVHSGMPSLFGGTPASTQTTQPADAAGANPADVPAGAPVAANAADDAVPGTSQAAASPAGQQVQIKTDVYDLTFDTLGAQLVKAQLSQFSGFDGSDSPMVLLDNTPNAFYVAQTGVVGAPAGQSFPTHLTPFRLVSADTALTGDTLDVVFEGESDGVKVTKTYTLERGSYNIHVKHNIQNTGNAPVTPSLYLQLTRDGNDPPNTSFFYNTFTGPAVYSAEEKYQKISFSDIDKGKASYIKQANDGWTAIVQHYFASAWYLSKVKRASTKPCAWATTCTPSAASNRPPPWRPAKAFLSIRNYGLARKTRMPCRPSPQVLMSWSTMAS